MKTSKLETLDSDFDDINGWLENLFETGVYAIAVPLEGPEYNEEDAEAILTLIEKLNRI